VTRPQRLWNILTAPRASDEDEARREYMTKVNLVVLGGTVHSFALIAFIACAFGMLPLDTPVLLAVMSLILIVGWWLAKMGHWRAAGYLPPLTFFAAAVYGNFIGGVDAPAMLLYALAIVLSATLQDRRGQVMILALCLTFYIGLGLAHAGGVLVALRSAQTAFLNRVSIAVAAIVGITVSVWFLSDQFQLALRRTRALAQEARANAENAAIFKTLVENVLNGIAVCDRSGRLTVVNRAGYALFGYDLAGQEMTGLAQAALWAEEGDLSAEAAFALALAGGWTGEVRLRRKDGSTFDGHLVMFPVYEKPDDVACLGMIFEDITARKQAERALQDSQEELRVLVETLPAAFYRCEVNFPWKMHYVNNGIFSFSGRQASEFTEDGLAYGTIVFAEDVPKLIRAVNEAVAQRQQYEHQYRVCHADGSLHWVYEKGEAVYSADGAPLYLHGIIIDVTEREQMERRAQLQERLAVVGQLAAGIAHDFNNIMATITLYSDLLTRETALSAAGQQRAQTVQQQAHRAADLISQLLDFSRWSVMEERTLLLLPFLKEFVNLLARILPENINLSLEYDATDYLIAADPSRMQQVLMNLALNARDAMPGGGELRFVVSRLIVKAGESAPFPDMAPGTWLRIVVADTGTGIPPDVLPRIFEPFFTTKRPGEGTGLGLSQVYRIVSQHGGRIDVASQIGVGTQFTLYFPALDVPTLSEAADTTDLVAGAGEAILVVEDDISTRDALVTGIENLGYTVLTASDGREALTVCQSQAVDLVLSDLVMPVLGGRALYEALKVAHPGLRVILMTGYPLTGEIRAFLERERIPWLQKPISLRAIAQLIRETLDG